MTELAAQRHDPLRVFRFRVSLGGEAVAGVQKVSGLRLTVGAKETWEGGNALHRYANPDRATWDPITLHQGLALNDRLERWANAVVEYLRTGRAPSGSEPVKRDVRIDVLAHHWPPDPEAPRSFLVLNAWISKYEAVPALDATGQEVALLSVELTHEGWRPLHPSATPGGGATVPPDLLSEPGATDLVLSPPGTAIA